MDVNQFKKKMNQLIINFLSILRGLPYATVIEMRSLASLK